MITCISITISQIFVYVFMIEFSIFDRLLIMKSEIRNEFCKILQPSNVVNIWILIYLKSDELIII